MSGLRRSLVLGAVVAMMAVGSSVPANAAPDQDGRQAPPGAATAVTAPPVEPSSVAEEKRDQVLGKGWRTSADRMMATSGDASGFHVMVADARDGYAWRTVATLVQPGIDADRWIGNACVTASGSRAVVVYAPRIFTNKPQMATRGGYTAVVDLASGKVRKLPIRTSLAFFNPGCGGGETAALTQEGDEDLGRTGIVALDTASGSVGKRIEVPGQLTSAVPMADGFVGATTSGVVRVEHDGRLTPLAAADGVPAYLKPDAEGRVVFMDHKDGISRVKRTERAGTPATTLATGRVGELGVTTGGNGKVFLTGTPSRVESLPATVTTLDVPAGATVSTTGETAVVEIRDSKAHATANALTPRPVHIAVKSVKSGHAVGFTVDPADRLTPRDQDLTDVGAVCAVKRNDTRRQVYQPKPKEVEWAVNMAVQDRLNVFRDRDWHGNGQDAYLVQNLFPSLDLTGGGAVPAQVMLGILGQESNLWQASRHLYPGDYGNPLIGNFYGVDIYNGTEADDWTIRWDKADCGYGVSQMTDGMRAVGKERPGETALSPLHQVAVATDFVANITAGMRLLQTKWNQLQAAGVTMNDNDPSKIENWFLAAWAYNSGYHNPGEPGANGAYGLGWLNNPANPRYVYERHPFGSNPRDFASPQQWPYPEKVMGFAAHPPSGFEAPGVEVPFFRAAWWNGTAADVNTPGSAKYNRANVKPHPYTFCVSDKNNCLPETLVTPNAPEVIGEKAGPCHHKNAAGQYDLKCWWHNLVIPKPDCHQTCGHQFIRYDPDYWNNPPDPGTSFPPTCADAGLPVAALVVDDVGRDTPAVRLPGCKRSNFANGTFSVAFAKDANGNEPGKIDLHQASGGYGAHYFFSHTKVPDPVSVPLEMTATWTLDQVVTNQATVMAFRPAAVANSKNPVTYVVNTAHGPRSVSVPWQRDGNHWVTLGTFPFNGKPSVSLSTMGQGDAGQRLPFDAIAFQPGAGSPWPTGKIATLVHDHSKKCLSFPNGDNGTAATQLTCNSAPTQSWEITVVGSRVEKVGAGEVTVYDHVLRNRGSGRCLEIAGGSVSDGAAAVQGDCVFGEHKQIWTSLENLTSPQFGTALTNLRSRKNIVVPNCSLVEGAPVVQVAPTTNTAPDCSAQTFSMIWYITFTP